VIAPDPRQIGREYPLAALPEDAALMPQVYWSDFQQPWRTTLERYLSVDVAPRPVAPLLPGDARTVDLRDALAWCAQKGYTHAAVWNLGALVGTAAPDDVDDFSVFADAAGPYAPLPAVLPPLTWTSTPAIPPLEEPVAPASPQPVTAQSGPATPRSDPNVAAALDRAWRATLDLAAAGNEAAAVVIQKRLVDAKIDLGLQEAA